jgi:hypothetical protein
MFGMSSMMKMMEGIEICTTHARRALRAFILSPKLKPFIDNGSIILPNQTSGFCIVINMPVGSRVLEVSVSIAPDRMGNRCEMGEISRHKPPSTMEILLQSVLKEFKTDLGYDNDIRSFEWDQSYSDDGFEKIIDEFIRIRNIINGDVAKD